MPRFYFDFHDEAGITIDDTGEEFPSADAARNEALATIGGLIKDILTRCSDTYLAIELRDNRSSILRVSASIQTKLYKG